MFRTLSLMALASTANILFAADEKKPGEWLNLVGSDLKANWITKGQWSLDQDGVIALKPLATDKGWSRFDAYLWSAKSYDDFEIEFEYKIERTDRSGFFFRVGDIWNPLKQGLKVSLGEFDEKSKSELSDRASGGLIPGMPPKKNAAKPAGEWNKMQITNKADKLTVILNGEKVNEVDLTKEKLKDRPKTGLIGFADEARPLWLKGIRIRELK